MKDTIALAIYLKENDLRPRQVQDFIPTPMAVATTMFYTGVDPLTMKPVYTATDLREKRLMKALIFWWDEASWPLAREALHTAGRTDLIGKAAHCLVPPEHAGRSPVGSPTGASVRRERPGQFARGRRRPRP